MAPDTLKHAGGMDRDKPEVLFATLQTILDNFPDMIFVKDVNLKYVAETQSFVEMVGISKDIARQIKASQQYE